MAPPRVTSLGTITTESLNGTRTPSQVLDTTPLPVEAHPRPKEKDPPRTRSPSLIWAMVR
jgi:hypothetical protein